MFVLGTETVIATIYEAIKIFYPFLTQKINELLVLYSICAFAIVLILLCWTTPFYNRPL